MYLEIVNNENQLNELFAQWLVRQIQDELILNVRKTQLAKWDAFFEQDTTFPKLSEKTKISTSNLLLFGIRNIVYQLMPSKICIRIKQNTFAPNFNQVQIETLCKLIEFGNQEISGSYIFTPVLSAVAENINDYVQRFYRGF